MTSCENQQKVSHIHVHTVCLPGQAFSVKMPGYWPFFKFIFIHLFSFFFSHSEVEVDKNACAKKRTRPISNLDPCAYAVWGEELWGRDCANIQSSWPKKLDLSHGRKQNFILCRVLLWTMTCNYWKVFSELDGFKAWPGFVPVSKLGLLRKISNAGPKKASVKDHFWLYMAVAY